MSEIYVTGHRNPDTDSIVSAMAYASLRNALGESEYVAARLGSVSDETQRMLDYFGLEAPCFVKDVRTQVKDLDFDRTPCFNATVTMDRAWHTMHNERISAIPVIHEDGALYGMLSAGDIASYSMDTIDDPTVEICLFSIFSACWRDGSFPMAITWWIPSAATSAWPYPRTVKICCSRAKIPSCCAARSRK